MTRLARSIATFTLAALVTAGVPSLFVAAASPAGASGSYPNGAIAEIALRYVGQPGKNACVDAGKGRSPAGECKTFVNCIVSMASVHTQYPIGGGTYAAEFKAVSTSAPFLATEASTIRSRQVCARSRTGS